LRRHQSHAAVDRALTCIIHEFFEQDLAGVISWFWKCEEGARI
jgi:hypothetical protein